MKYNLEPLNIILPISIIIITIIIIMIFNIIKTNKQKSYLLTLTSIIITILILIFNINHKIKQLTNILFVNTQTITYTLITLIGSLSTCIYSKQWINNYHKNKNEFYIFILISSLGNIILINSNNLLSLLISIELISIPIIGLIGYSLKYKNTIQATIKYKILSSISLSFIIFGISLIYIANGNMTYDILKKYLYTSSNKLMITGISMILIGVSFKMSIVPFHLWISDVYTGSPIPTINFLNTTNKIAFFYAMYNLFSNTCIININSIKIIFEYITFLSIILGNLMALFQKNIKKILAYSSITHSGNLLIIILNSKNNLSFETAIIYITSYLFNYIGLFGMINKITCNKLKEKCFIKSIKGMFWRNKIHAFTLIIILLSFSGFPMTIGFISKFYILMLTITSHLWWLTITIIFSNIIGFCYYLNIIKIIFYKKQTKKNKIQTYKNKKLQNILIYLSVIIIISLGLYPQTAIDIIKIIK